MQTEHVQPTALNLDLGTVDKIAQFFNLSLCTIAMEGNGMQDQEVQGIIFILIYSSDYYGISHL